MAQTELDEIREYWAKKYPNVDITLYPYSGSGKYFGRMTTLNESYDLQADTLGELISQGEVFLRRVTQ